MKQTKEFQRGLKAGKELERMRTSGKIEAVRQSIKDNDLLSTTEKNFMLGTLRILTEQLEKEKG